MKEYTFKSNCGSFCLIIPGKIVDKMKTICQQADRFETGGVLIGRYSTNLKEATVEHVTSPTKDSKQGKSSFVRGIMGLQKKLDYYWAKNKEFYIGEWHYHPYSSPKPSGIDIKQMKTLSSNKELKCPEPILIIFGRSGKEWIVSINVFVNNEVINLTSEDSNYIF